MTFRLGGKAARSAAAIGHRKDVVSPQQQAELRRQRLILTVAGSVAFCGLATLAYHYTAPFADPPSYAVTAQATAVALPATVAAETEDLPDDAVRAAAEPAGQAALPAEPAAAPPQPPVAAPVDTAASADVEILPSNDPRWGAATATASQAPAAAPAESGELAYAAGNPAAAALRRTVVDDPTDDTETAAIPSSRPAIEAIEPEPPSVADGPAPTRKATIASAVNMRAKGAKGARVLGVIPRGATVGLVECDGWCEVVYEGRRGFVYKSFLDDSDRTADASETAPPRRPSKPKIVPPRQVDIDQFR